jgi:cyclopropane fatty-acyl-phospholipid synthase-like methyltransferase
MVMIVACMSLSTACTQQVAPSGEHAAMLRREPDVPFVTTPPAVVARMLEIARVTKDDVVYDLGSGDGRIVIMAAQKFGARGVGVEIDPELVSAAQENAKKAGVAGRVQFVLQDLFDVDISAATVVTLYLTQAVNLQLRPKLWRELKPGTRVVSHDFSMGDWRPEQVVYIDRSIIYAWTIPAATMPRP